MAGVGADIEAGAPEPVAFHPGGLQVGPQGFDAAVELFNGSRVGGVSAGNAEAEDDQVGVGGGGALPGYRQRAS